MTSLARLAIAALDLKMPNVVKALAREALLEKTPRVSVRLLWSPVIVVVVLVLVVVELLSLSEGDPS